MREHSKLLPTFNLLPNGQRWCKWTMTFFEELSFSREKILLSSAEVTKLEKVKRERQVTLDHTATSLKKGREISFAQPVKHTTLLGDTIDGSISINGRLLTCKDFATKKPCS